MMTQFDDDDRETTRPESKDGERVEEFSSDHAAPNDYPLESPSAPPAPNAQSVKSDYYSIVDADEWPLAGLVVLIDRRRQAVRAELHLYEDGERQNEYALRRAESILSNQYYSMDPVQLQVMQSYPWRETLEIHANAEPASPQTDVMAIFQEYWQYIVGAAALLILFLFIWLLASFFGSPEDTSTTLATETMAPTVAVDGAAPAEDSPPPTAPLVGEQTNGLGPSTNADPNLAVGKRARVEPGLTVALVSEPVSDQEKVVGYWREGEEAVLIDGPVRKQGNADTIIWWRVRLDDGMEAWAPANTSELTLIRVVE